MRRLQREFIILPAWDKRDPDPRKNYGIHGCEVVFYLHSPGKAKTVQFKCYTDWLPKHIQREALGRGTDSSVTQIVIGVQPSGADLGYHSPKPRYKGQSRMQCDLSKRGYCYYDGSGLAAEEVRDVMLEEGSEGVWRELEQYYKEVFGGN